MLNAPQHSGENIMVQCRYCKKETGKSKNYQHLHFHLLYKHGLVAKQYKKMFPKAPIVSERFREKQRALMSVKRQRYKDLAQRQNKWRNKITDNYYRDNYYRDLEPTRENIELLEERIQYLKYGLAAGLRGYEYRKTLLDLRELKSVLDELRNVHEKKR